MLQKLSTTTLLLITVLFGVCAAEERDPTSRGLEWLTKHQEPDGHWDSVKFGALKKADTATTSLALLALLGSGYSEKVGAYKDNVRRAVAWLKSKQDAKGRIFDTTDDTEFPREATDSAMALLAMAEAAAMANQPETRAAAQKAADYCAEIYPIVRTTTAAGEATFTLDKAMTTPLVGWYVMAFKSAKVAGLKVHHEAIDCLIVYLDSVEHKLEKAPGDDNPPGEYWYRQNERLGDGHPIHRVSAVGCLCRQFLGWKKEELQSTVRSFLKVGGYPTWTKDTENVDLYYWYIGTLVTFYQNGMYGYILGNPQFEDGVNLWKKWSEARTKALEEHQCTEGDNAGSWSAPNPASPDSRDWGRVGQTALACLCLQTYIR